jgi:hypothetical protein
MPIAKTSRESGYRRDLSWWPHDVPELGTTCPGAGWVLWYGQVGDDTVVVACPDAVDRAIKQSLAVHHLQQRPMPPGSYEHVVNAAGYGCCHFTRTHQRVLRCECQSWVCGPCRLPSVLIANAHSVDGSPAAPEVRSRPLQAHATRCRSLDFADPSQD